MNRPILRWVLLVGAFLVAGDAFSADPDGDHANKRRALLAHREFLVRAYADREGSGGEKVRELLRTAPDVPLGTEEWNVLVAMTMQDSVCGLLRDRGPGTGFIQDDEVVDIMVAVLQDADRRGFPVIWDWMTWKVSGELLRKHGEEIRKALAHDLERPTGDAIALYARCGLTPEQKGEMLLRPNVPPMVRALCGDREAETDLIARFGKSKDFREKRSLARELAYVGTSRCVEALIDGLRSPVISESDFERRSIRGKIVLALGMVYEEERLFTAEAGRLNSWGDEVFEERYGLERYVGEVDRWVRERFGRSAWGETEVWFKRHRKDPVIHHDHP